MSSAKETEASADCHLEGVNACEGFSGGDCGLNAASTADRIGHGAAIGRLSRKAAIAPEKRFGRVAVEAWEVVDDNDDVLLAAPRRSAYDSDEVRLVSDYSGLALFVEGHVPARRLVY